jgi:hypothetical protein
MGRPYWFSEAGMCSSIAWMGAETRASLHCQPPVCQGRPGYNVPYIKARLAAMGAVIGTISMLEAASGTH